MSFYAKTTSRSFASVRLPDVTRMFSMVASRDARSAGSIFIASMLNSTSPAAAARVGRTATPSALSAEHEANQKKRPQLCSLESKFGASRRGTQGYGRSDAAPSARCVGWI